MKRLLLILLILAASPLAALAAPDEGQITQPLAAYAALAGGGEPAPARMPSTPRT